MSKTMAEVLAEHDDTISECGYWFCLCGYEYGVYGGFGEVKINHQAAALLAAGFGVVAADPDAAEAERRARSWEPAARHYIDLTDAEKTVQ